MKKDPVFRNHSSSYEIRRVVAEPCNSYLVGVYSGDKINGIFVDVLFKMTNDKRLLKLDIIRNLRAKEPPTSNNRWC